MAYYPSYENPYTPIIKKYPELELVDETEEYRMSALQGRHDRGKRAPKKAKSKGMKEVFLCCSKLELIP